ncbi:hypothetical protein SKTS_26990 [Sulfurimicrobium lacus]|uniref:histidine kinase n=1 Tax=Sulfurimicrobium lacus TaxID=2715678 RepID=A0A6F8VDB8_9PROT|nr:histidine kinase dimerization/phospho-acceptor domain-containing protein [Sulfurimicrobium lacus]BCB27813.1 hypothetical protein SKTS_26990 [Sulfurimicrobium lacus]
MKLDEVCNNAQCPFAPEMPRICPGLKPVLDETRQAKAQLIAHIGHELRTPLNTILGFAQMLDCCSDDTKLGEERESIDSILAASRQLLHSIGTLLALETVEIGDPESELRSPS